MKYETGRNCQEKNVLEIIRTILERKREREGERGLATGINVNQLRVNFNYVGDLG